MLDIISGKESVRYEPNQQTHLLLGVAEVFARRGEATADASRSFRSMVEPELKAEDELLALEVFWDLVLDRIITPGLNRANPLPFFRVHSEAKLS